MITADTITDEQIRELRESVRGDLTAQTLDELGAVAWMVRNAKLTAAHYSARVALGEKRARRGDSRAKARARCAEILNARAKEAS